MRDRGVELSTSSWSACRSSENFHNPDEFKSERWLDRNSTDKKHTSQPLSLGSRVCIGRNLALKEIRLVLSKMLWVYDMELVNEDLDLDRDSTTYFLWIKPEIWMRFTRRQGVQVLLELAQKRSESKHKVMGPMNKRKKEIDVILLVLPIDAPETGVLIAVRSMNIHQYDSSHFLVPHVPSSLATGRTYLYCMSH
ncbi:cytochrome P450 [Tuber borchii]|uniref:Cytochrome P450 n=1 Tax=Tuber borchii TaxID=42251 RepID=A0A2T6ZBN7_TUBBO|nr:cytochrome P450 [Tuber borchii]